MREKVPSIACRVVNPKSRGEVFTENAWGSVPVYTRHGYSPTMQSVEGLTMVVDEQWKAEPKARGTR